MFFTDEHGLTQPTDQQEQDWTENDDFPPESQQPDAPELGDPAPSGSPPDDDLPF